MEPRVHNEPQRNYSDFLRFSTRLDKFKSESATTDNGGLTYLRVELERLRFGMSDFLVRIATPKADSEDTNTVVVLRGNRDMTKNEVMLGTARVLVREMLSRGDKSYTWDKANPERIAKLLAAPIKSFAMNLNIETMSFATEAL